MFIVILPLPIYATQPGNDSSPTSQRMTYDEMVSLAIKTFPEYESKIKGEQHLTPRGRVLLMEDTQPELVHQEIKSISELDYITYQEYSNGAVLLSLGISGKRTVTDSYTISDFTYITLNMYTFCSYAQNMILVEDIEFHYKPGAYSEITIDGTSAHQTGFAMATRVAFQQTGNDITPAYLKYQGTLDINDSWGALGVVQKDVYLALSVTTRGYSVSAGWA